MKSLSKLLAVLLAALLLLTVCVLPSTAQDTPALQYVVLGDSIGWGAGVLNSNEACFGRIVADTNGYEFTRLAVNGDRSENLLRHLREDTYISAVSDADIISISIGGNDYLTNNMIGLILQAYLGSYSRFDEIAATLNANFSQIIETILALNPDV